MSEVHAHTAAAQADVQRADVQDRPPNIPPGHVEARRPAARRFGAAGLWPLLAVALAVAAIGAGIGLALLTA